MVAVLRVLLVAAPCIFTSMTVSAAISDNLFNGESGVPFKRVTVRQSSTLNVGAIKDKVRVYANKETVQDVLFGNEKRVQIEADDVAVADIPTTFSDPEQRFKLTIKKDGLVGARVLDFVNDQLVGTGSVSWLPYDVTAAETVQNSPTSIAANIEGVPTEKPGMYPNQEIPLYVRVTDLPSRDLTDATAGEVLSIALDATDTDLYEFEPSIVTFASACPLEGDCLRRKFMVKSKTKVAVGNINMKQEGSFSGTFTGSPVEFRVLQPDPMQVHIIETTRFYEKAWSAVPIEFYIQKNADPTVNVIVTPSWSKKSSGGTWDAVEAGKLVMKLEDGPNPAENVTITTPGETGRQRLFFKLEEKGDYKVTFEFPDPWTADSGVVMGRDNSDVVTFTKSSILFSVKEREVITMATPEAAHYVADFDPDNTDYGGAWGKLSITLSEAPNEQLILKVADVDHFSAESESVTFGNTETEKTLKIRATKKEDITIRFESSGASASEFTFASSSVTWEIKGKNVDCAGETADAACWGQNGCKWDAVASTCLNEPLAITIGEVPLLFHDVLSPEVTITLPTPVRHEMDLFFVPSGGMSFVPETLTFASGKTTGKFQVRANLPETDAEVKVEIQIKNKKQSANDYAQPSFEVRALPSITCELSQPQRGFFVGMESDDFNLTCTRAIDSDVTFTPVAIGKLGVLFHPAKLVLVAGETALSFIAESTSPNDFEGATVIKLEIEKDGTATDPAKRFGEVPQTKIRILEQGTVNIPPRFVGIQHYPTDKMHLDLTIPPPEAMEALISVLDEDDNPVPESDVRVEPNPVVYAPNQKEGTFLVTGHKIGSFSLNVTLQNGYMRSFKQPTSKVTVSIIDGSNGPADSARMTPGFLSNRKACRLNVGVRSVRFRGQERVVNGQLICADPLLAPNPDSTSTFDCSPYVTEYRCHRVLEETGNACLWVNSTCKFFSKFQGNLEYYQFGSGFTVLLTKEKKLFTAGAKSHGALGHSGDCAVEEDCAREVELPLTESDGKNKTVSEIAVGSKHVMVVMEGEQPVFAWGANHKGQLGVGGDVSFVERPRRIRKFDGSNVTCITAGQEHSAAIVEDSTVALQGTTNPSTVYVWGSNKYGQLGPKKDLGNMTATPFDLSRVVLAREIHAVQLGDYHTMLYDERADKTFTAGFNTFGQLGREGFDEDDFAEPQLFAKLPVDDYPDSNILEEPNYPGFVSGKRC